MANVYNPVVGNGEKYCLINVVITTHAIFYG